MTLRLIRVAVPSPLPRLFDYLAPDSVPWPLPPGVRVQVPFGHRKLIGLAVSCADTSDVPSDRLRPILAVLDAQPVIPADVLALALDLAGYYHHPPGDVLDAVLPKRLRQGAVAEPSQLPPWMLTPAGEAACADEGLAKRAPRQHEALQRLHDAGRSLGDSELASASTRRSLQQHGWIVRSEHRTPEPLAGDVPVLTDDQQAAVAVLEKAGSSFCVSLLFGITGSGKTEVYLERIALELAAGRQTLVLVPEIALTPQLVDRFTRRLGTRPSVLHSALTDVERLDAWLDAARGQAGVLIGTRSAVFTPLARPGLIVVDEEHDGSFKQQDGFRYHARDAAIWRARRLDIPVILGSATPSLETWANAARGRYTRIDLTRRAGGARPPRILTHDLRGKRLREGLSEPLWDRLARCIDAGEQALVFLNRRGFAPTLLCHDCGWIAECPRCTARLTVHRAKRQLHCHHCGHEVRLPPHCPSCGSAELRPIGQGTERLEDTLAAAFGAERVVRIDRDTTRRRGSLEALLNRVRDGRGQILLGTQMLAKGHDFPAVTLAIIVDADQGLFSPDYRAEERLAQMLIQVAGRAGRGVRPGEVVIQTHQPDHPLLLRLLSTGYGAFAEQALAERHRAGLPPVSHQALLRAEAHDQADAEAFLHAAQALAPENRLEWWGPAPAILERRAGRYRQQLMINAPDRRQLHALLGSWVPTLYAIPEARKVRWSLDVDPQAMD